MAIIFSACNNTNNNSSKADFETYKDSDEGVSK